MARFKLGPREITLLSAGCAALFAVGVWGRPTLDVAEKAPAPSPVKTVDAPEQPGQIGVRALLEELVDLTRLARLPDPAFTAHLASSYDRRSTNSSDRETWFANDDWISLIRPNYVRLEQAQGRREYVLLDEKGPGAVVRIWSATPTGTLRIYVDGEAVPVLEAPLESLLSGGDAVPPPLSYVASKGYNSYFPFPYRKAMKITVDEIVAKDPFNGGPLEKFYYQINVRRYAPAVASRVRSFRASDFEQAQAALQRAKAVFEQPWTIYEPSGARKILALSRNGDEISGALEVDGGGMVRELVLRVGESVETALRKATLTLSFDDEVTVRAPLGDFFGTGPGLGPFESLPFAVGADGRLVCRFPMPFQKRVAISIQGGPALEGEASVEPAPWSDQSLYFHARWRPPERVSTRPFKDLGLIAIQGSGTFVGSVFNIKNPQGAKWWGEGDEKVYVDGERFPSSFGTGTEDYYGYAWSGTERFSAPLHAQTRAGSGGFGGRFSVNRFHVLDAIPFSSALRFDMELWHWDETVVTWDAMTYYYARPGAKDDAPPLAAEDLRIP